MSEFKKVHRTITIKLELTFETRESSPEMQEGKAEKDAEAVRQIAMAEYETKAWYKQIWGSILRSSAEGHDEVIDVSPEREKELIDRIGSKREEG